MIKGTLVNTETNTTRETLGNYGIVATIDTLGHKENEATVDIHIEYDKSGSDDDYIAIIKEILKFTIERNRKAFAKAVYQACQDTGFLSNLNGVECLLFRKTKKEEPK